jgi:hypothetical protein
MNLQSAIDEIATTAGLNPAVAERAVGIILSVVQQDVDPAVVAQVFSKLPGAAELAAANVVSASSGGFLSSIAGSVLGAKAGVAAAGLSQLESSGLTLTQIELAAEELLAYVKANAGATMAAKIAGSLPGIRS